MNSGFPHRIRILVIFLGWIGHSFCETPVFELPVCGQDPAVKTGSNVKGVKPNLLGKKIFEQHCLDCHGKNGDGVDGGYEKPLQGVLSVTQLADYIEKTMPEEDPKSCVGNDAKKVAAYVFNEFYSVDAQNRRNPPKPVFSRLTNDQYRNAVADLISAYFGRNELLSSEPGLRGIYYSSRSNKRSAQADDRIDQQIQFDFKEGSPEKVKGKEFSVRWTGSLIAQETGNYTMIVQSANSVRLRFNGQRKPLIDANVVSGDNAEYRQNVFLLAGRHYDIQIEYSRFKEKTASIELRWIRPNGIEEVIPATQFSRQRTRPLFVPTTRFPADDASYGYPRGISISKEWTDSVSRSAIEVAQLVNRYFDIFVKKEGRPEKYRENAQRFCESLATAAFRRPLTSVEKNLYVLGPFKDPAREIREATRSAVVLIFKSPHFLYFDLQPDRKKPAFYLAMTLWDSLPDSKLIDDEKRGQLKNEKSADPSIARMLKDRRTQIKLQKFFEHWLQLDSFHGLSKDQERFPGFDARLADDLRRSLLIQMNTIAWSDKSDFRQFFATDEWLVNQRIADFYQVKMPETAPGVSFASVKKTGDGGGILTHPYLMSGFSYDRTSSPIHRGVFLAKSILGRRLNPPPDAFPPFDGEIAKSWTTREKVTFQTKPITCQRCHSLINELGFALENYDAVGKYRSEDNRKPVNAAGMYHAEGGNLVRYTGADELARFLMKHDEVQDNFVEELFQYLVKQPLAAYGPDVRNRLVASFAKNDFQIRKLLIEIAKVAAFQVPSDLAETALPPKSKKRP